jgi:hypothetical protein
LLAVIPGVAQLAFVGGSYPRPNTMTLHTKIILALTYLLLALNAAADWPARVDSKKDVEFLPSSAASIRARGMHDPSQRQERSQRD